MGASLSKRRQKPNNKSGIDQVSGILTLQPSQPKATVYTTIDEPNFSHPYRDVSMPQNHSMGVEIYVNVFARHTQPVSLKDDFSFPLDDRDFNSVANEELVALFSTAPRLHEFSLNKVVRISKTLVLKGGPSVMPSQAENMIFATELLHLPVPQVRRSFTASVPVPYGNNITEDGHFIVMDYVAGRTVEESWPALGQDARDSVIQQVADMIEKMQSRRLNDMPPGPHKSPNEKCQGPWFTDYGAGPFTTLQELQDWFNHKVDVCIQVWQVPADFPRFVFRDLVFTHQDIAERNLVLDGAGKVWLVDWGCAGVYPVGFEQAALREQCSMTEFAEKVLSKLSDRHDDMARQKAGIAYGLSTGRHL